MEGGRGFELLAARVNLTIQRATPESELAEHALALETAFKQLRTATQAAWSTGKPGEALANAVPYMQAFGHTVLAWIWLDVARAALAVDTTKSMACTVGRLGATRYFYNYELPKIGAWLGVVQTRDLTCAGMPEEAF